MSGPPSLPLGHDARLYREEAEWMIQDMGWTPADFSSQGNTALMRARFSEAIAAFSLQAKVLAAETQRHAAPAGPPEAEAAIEEVEIKSHSSTEVVESDTEVCEPTQLEACAQCDFSTSPQQTWLVRIAVRTRMPMEARLVRTPWTNRTASDSVRCHACAGGRHLFCDKLLPSHKTGSSRTSPDWSWRAQPQ